MNFFTRIMSNKYFSFTFRTLTALNIADKKNIVPIMTRVGGLGSYILYTDDDCIVPVLATSYMSPVIFYSSIFAMVDSEL
jgi:hypothetical protein